MQKSEYIHIIDLPDAENNIIRDVRLKDEIDTLRGIYAVGYIPLKGAAPMDGFKEEGQFRCGLLSVRLNNHETTFTIPVYSSSLQGYLVAEENLYNYNRQLLFRPFPLNIKIPANTTLRLKYRDNRSPYRFKHNIKLIISYYDK